MPLALAVRREIRYTRALEAEFAHWRGGLMRNFFGDRVMKRLSWMISAIVCTTASTAAWGSLLSGLDPAQINIGADSSGKIRVVFAGGPMNLPEVHSGGFDGFRSDEPGFHSIENDQPNFFGPGQPFLKLAPTTQLRLEVTIDFTPPLRGYFDGTFVDYFQLQGDTWDMGSGAPGSEVHPFWSVDMTDPEFTTAPWVATYKIMETNNKGYTDSDSYFITFTPEPGSLVLLTIGGFAVLRRNKRSR
jgi:hypothetical protein